MDPKRWETLSAAYVEGTLDEAAAEELLRAVEADPEARRDLVRQVRTDRLLRAARITDADPVIRAIASRRPSHLTTRVIRRLHQRPATSARPWMWAFSGAAAALLLVAGALARRPSTPPPPAPRPEPVVVEEKKKDTPPPPRERIKLPETFIPPAPAPAPEAPAVPRPSPAPAAAPAPAPAPVEPAPSVAEEKAVAVLEGAVPRELRAGETVNGRAAVRYPDGSRLELSDGGEIRPQGARVASGTVTAVVAKQPAGRPFQVSTPQADAVVLGTKFVLRVDAGSTALEVLEGRVRLKRLSDGLSVEVGAGLSATAAKGTLLAARPTLRVLAFQDGVSPDAAYAGTRDTTIVQLAPSENRGADAQLSLARPVEGTESSLLSFDLSAIPPGSRVVAAELTLWVTGALSPPGWRLHEMRRPWDEAGATWKSAWPSAGERGRLLGTLAPSTTGAVTIPLAEAVVQQWIGGPNFGLVFVPLGSSARWGLESREAARPDRRPRLSVTFLPPFR